MTEQPVTLEAFAALEGWKLAFVKRLRACNRLVLTDDGEALYPEASRERIASTRDPDKRAEATAGITWPVGVRDFAHIIGCQPSYVTRLRNDGRLVMATDGKRINVRESLARIEATRSPDKDQVAQRWEQYRDEEAQRQGHDGEPSAAADDGEEPRADHDYQKARAAKEHYQALTAKAEYEKTIGALCSVEHLKRGGADIGAAIRSAYENVSEQLASKVAGTPDTEQCLAFIDEAMTDVLQDISEQLKRLVREAEQGDA